MNLKKQKMTAVLAGIAMTCSCIPVNVLALAEEAEVKAEGTEVPQYDESSYEVQELDAIEYGEIDFNDNWKFYLSTTKGVYNEETVIEDKVADISVKSGLKDGEEGPQTAEIVQPDFEDSGWRTVQVPHDWGFEFARYDNPEETTSGTGYLPGGVGFYRKTFTVPAEMEGKKISVEFDGVYMNSAVYVNGELVGEYPNGYMGFTYDISKYLVYGGENVITVRCQDKVPSARWYPGHGIYRPVRILVDNDTRFVQNGVYLYTPDIGKTYPADQTAELHVDSEVYSTQDVSDVTVVTTLYDEDGEVFASGASDETSLVANQVSDVDYTFTVENAELWDCDDPNLYKAVVELYHDGEVIDSYATDYGFKWFEVTATEGAKLNGEFIMLNGVNIHHENGMIGTVSEPDALERKVKIMKEMGVNAIRTSHNPESVEFLNACNRQGVMVLEEAADFVTGGKGGANWGQWFSDEVPEDWAGIRDGGLPSVTLATDGQLKEAPYCWGDENIQEMVRRHRNNPCIIMWSTANELRNISEAPEWATDELMKDLYATESDPNPVFGINTEMIRLAQRVLQEDPYHIIVQATDVFRNGVEASKEEYGEQWINGAKYLESIGGVLGTQYSVKQTYEDIRKNFPNLATMETEASLVHTARGSYYGGKEIIISRDMTAGMLGGGGYGNGSYTPYREYSIKNVRDHGDINLGQFVWTGIDYMGEGWNTKIENEPDMVATGHHGLVEISGTPKDAYYLFQSQWTSKEDAPMAHLVPADWNKWAQGQSVPVLVYTNCPKAELFLNGESLGVRSFDKKVTRFGMEYYETSENTDDDKSNTSDVNTGGYVSPTGTYGNLHLSWDVPYEAGELKVVAYDEDGTVLAEDIVATHSYPKSVKLEADKMVMKADGEGMIYITASIVDENGYLCRDASDLVKVEVSGAKIAGISNGYQGEYEAWKYNGTQYSYYTEHTAHIGSVVFALKSEGAGAVNVKVYGDDLEPGYLTVYAQADEADDIIGYEETHIRVPVGKELVLPEKVTAVLKNGETAEEDAEWTTIPTTETAGEYEAEAANGAKAYISVYEITEIEPVELVVYGNVDPVLPELVSVTCSDGVTEYVPVTWNGLEGSIEGTDKTMTATVEKSDEEQVNLADSSRFEMKATANFTSADIRQAINVTDGRLDTFWDNRVAVSRSLAFDISIQRETSLDVSYVELDWADYQTINKLNLYFNIGDILEDADGKVPSRDFFQNGSSDTPLQTAMPEKIQVEYWDGSSWKIVDESETVFAEESQKATVVTFDTVTAKRLRIHMYNATPYTPEGTIQLCEVEAFASDGAETFVEKTADQQQEKETETVSAEAQAVDEAVAARAEEVIRLFSEKEYEEVFDLCDHQMVGELLGYSSLLKETWEDLLNTYGDYKETDHVDYTREENGYTTASFVLVFEKAKVTFNVKLDTDNLLNGVSVIGAESIN